MCALQAYLAPLKCVVGFREPHHPVSVPGPLRNRRKKLRYPRGKSEKAARARSRGRSRALIGNPATGAVFTRRTFDCVSVMVLASQCAKSAGVGQGSISSEDGVELHGPEKAEKGGTTSIMARGPKSRASRETVPKRKEKQPERRHGGGELSMLPGMPLDILYEVSPGINPASSDGMLHDDIFRRSQIFAVVHPMDLLRVSWANKAFRNILAKETSRHVWIASFDNLPKSQRPPRCPEDLTEIAYANLLYNPLCMVCTVLCFTSHG